MDAAPRRHTLAYESEEPNKPPPPTPSQSFEVLSFDVVAQLPAPGDNAAIAKDQLEAGQLVRYKGTTLKIVTRVLEGHRFAVAYIAHGELITSWGEAFAKALRPIAPGDWLRNAKAITALLSRGLAPGFTPNFADYVKPAALSEASFVPGPSTPLPSLDECFHGFVRTPATRGVGTRNFLVVLPLSSRANAFARALERRLVPAARAEPTDGLDGIVALPHTEDGGSANASAARNHHHLLRTLLGLLLHPNVGAALVLQTEADVAAAKAGAGISYPMLAEAASQHPERFAALGSLPHITLRLKMDDFTAELDAAAEAASTLLPDLRAMRRVPCAASSLIVAQQCGGSDAFSGTAANPLVAAASKHIVEAGGAALLAETDELIGAEQYVLQNVRDYPTARRFVDLVARFHGYANAHGASAEGNPSGGNLYRGLYNIALKSLGAAMKRHPHVRLEHVVEYAEPLPPPRPLEEAAQAGAVASDASDSTASRAHGAGRVGAGFCFMDSPGNDLESVAGQVASGCNLIYFSTGNGSITNFPFVPTIKIVSTSRRYAIMAADMDVDAADAALTEAERGESLFRLSLEVASGQKTRGEAAGHYQLQIWRNWERASAGGPVRVFEPPPAAAAPLSTAAPPSATHFSALGAWSSSPLQLATLSASASTHLTTPPMYGGLAAPEAAAAARAEVAEADAAGSAAKRARIGQVPATESVALVLPTSLCSSEVARSLAGWLQAELAPPPSPPVRFVALPHTEGCGVSDERLGAATLLGHLRSPLVARALLLEHGCEKTHNDYFSQLLKDDGADPTAFGWASLQADGGISAARSKIAEYFRQRLPASLRPREPAELLRLGVALLVAPGDAAPAVDTSPPREPLPETVALTLAHLASLVARRGMAVLPEGCALLQHPTFLESTLAETPRPTLSFACRPQPEHAVGLHVMQAPSSRWVETLSGVGGVGVHMALTWLPPGAAAPPGHPLVPMLSVTLEGISSTRAADVVLPADGTPATWLCLLLEKMSALASGEYTPLVFTDAATNVDFQIPRAGSCSL